ncbi:hypothetical protein [Dysgonomonas sp. 25]|uniref:hypothetical protein n=1 Tax=Dysgonomonas sp. 25 TaxID=2302933 RepID=UPI0013D040E8|nr:hypothetical protein [Dysgonomonas sp. 25]NDV68119.1 hypothetical protein [Dysgonomonas sp. 25]
MKNIISIIPVLFLFTTFSCKNGTNSAESENEKTVFQTSREWRPTIDNRADVAIVYGVGGNPSDKSERIPFEERVKSWRERGYTVHFMTGIAWGEYQDYFTGEWDGKPHLDEGQVQLSGDTIWHGHMVPYIVPSDNFLKYLKERHVKRVVDAGIDAIFMEEPEFWARAGYSEAFKKEWKEYYGFDWRPQHESPENTYLANKLKYHLYYKAIKDVFTYAKEYGKSKGMNVRCYVPTHSLVNYSQWQIVSPEASLASLDCVDGYIAQVWTGTSREPNYYNGIRKERVFENAFLEYGSMESMTAPTGRKMFFLTDPIEDWPRDWVDYKRNYEATFTAQLLYPNIADYEVMPWPERIYEGLYRTSADSDVKDRIPKHYSTQMQVMINTLNSMPLSDNKVSGSSGISVLMANSLMFQRFPTHASYEDPQLSNFYGQALPFLKRGIPVSTTHIENVSYAGTFKNTKILLMTYSNMKPSSAEEHEHIANWVKNGGILVYSGSDTDPFQTVQEWWNTKGNNYKAPADHLFEKMNIAASPTEGEYSYGSGTVYVIRTDPKDFVMKEDLDQKLVDVVKSLYEEKAGAGELEFKNNFYLERGPYHLIAVMDESVSEEPYIAKGLYIDLFNPELPVLRQKIVHPGQQALLYNVESVADKSEPQVLASACRIYDEEIKGKSYSFVAKSPIDTKNYMRILLPSKPSDCEMKKADGTVLCDTECLWDEFSKTCLFVFDNDPDGVYVSLKW